MSYGDPPKTKRGRLLRGLAKAMNGDLYRASGSGWILRFGLHTDAPPKTGERKDRYFANLDDVATFLLHWRRDVWKGKPFGAVFDDWLNEAQPRIHR